MTSKKSTYKRKTISKAMRFEVFKRDSFKCQYCGKCAPDVILHIDHINPVSRGGENEILNLITACEDCNGGKSNRLLSDDSVMSKQRAQLEDLNARREQLKQMLAWRDGMKNINELAVQSACNAWQKIVEDRWCVNDNGKETLKKLIVSIGLPPVLDAIDICAKYLKPGDERLSGDSVMFAFSKIGGIARMSAQPDWRRDLFYIRGIVRNRMGYIDQNACIRLLEQAYQICGDIEYLKAIALGTSSWSRWVVEMQSITEE